jgi:RNA recognition motif-containing protein
VEYATREQAQQAVATLSNQNLMGRLIYVREVRHPPSHYGTYVASVLLTSDQDREAEPRFGPPGGAGRGGFGGGMGAPYAGAGGFNPGMAGGGGRQIYVSNVSRSLS